MIISSGWVMGKGVVKILRLVYCVEQRLDTVFGTNMDNNPGKDKRVTSNSKGAPSNKRATSRRPYWRKGKRPKSPPQSLSNIAPSSEPLEEKPTEGAPQSPLQSEPLTKQLPLSVDLPLCVIP
ncbi:unnamed protein product [Notodromas monacha]|uniref:Uncharacterized protein n=1 Tax=Notodromas monacha TaxID=399045 RepID=A0A7R9GJ16_9CRUS|nr:unnamed protein product [Notodromas monacha]CAG0923167.1 unnamed protein product [Notodromas monacha]